MSHRKCSDLWIIEAFSYNIFNNIFFAFLKNLRRLILKPKEFNLIFFVSLRFNSSIFLKKLGILIRATLYATPYTDADKFDCQKPNRTEWLTAVVLLAESGCNQMARYHCTKHQQMTKRKKKISATFMVGLRVAAIISHSNAHSSSFCRNRLTRFAILSLFCADKHVLSIFEDLTRSKPVMLTNRRESRDSDASALIHSTAT